MYEKIKIYFLIAIIFGTCIICSGCRTTRGFPEYDKSGNYLGMIITVKDSNGYGGDIRMTVGIDKAETITGLEFLELNETAGLGMKAKESSFKNQFKGKKADKINYSKSGAQADDEIDAISSATITTSAVCEGVNAAISAYKAVGGVEQ